MSKGRSNKGIALARNPLYLRRDLAVRPASQVGGGVDLAGGRERRRREKEASSQRALDPRF